MFIVLTILFFHQCWGQAQTDTAEHSPYKFHLNYKPQDGYGITLGFLGSQREEHNIITGTRNIYKIGIAKTTHDYNEEGVDYISKSLSLEINQITNNTLYGFVGGVDNKGFFLDLGIYLNYLTDFSTSRSFSIRPQFALSAFHWFNLDLTIEYDINVIKPNYDNVSNWLIGLQYTIGVVRHD